MTEDFESARFYETLFSMLINRKGIEIKNLKRGDVCLYFDVWREPYKVGNRKVSETFMEVIIGYIEKSKP
ncbi:MAG: hypothetical protein OEY40_03165, partial [Candidatus Bathyarchaeota archaeon]|nr:hypothetical protein [Candidatus Bathyarchaeota archaeon]